MKKETRQTGFTLVELLVTMAVLIITLAVGVPWYNSLVENNRAIAQANMLISAINLAKSEAISRGESVTLAANGGGTDWTAGWTVSVGGAAIKTWEALEGNPQVTTTPVTGSITFSGQAETAQAVSFEMTQTNSTTNQTRCIRVSRVGLIGFERNACP